MCSFHFNTIFKNQKKKLSLLNRLKVHQDHTWPEAWTPSSIYPSTLKVQECLKSLWPVSSSLIHSLINHNSRRRNKIVGLHPAINFRPLFRTLWKVHLSATNWVMIPSLRTGSDDPLVSHPRGTLSVCDFQLWSGSGNPILVQTRHWTRDTDHDITWPHSNNSKQRNSVKFNFFERAKNEFIRCSNPWEDIVHQGTRFGKGLQINGRVCVELVKIAQLVATHPHEINVMGCHYMYVRSGMCNPVQLGKNAPNLLVT